MNEQSTTDPQTGQDKIFTVLRGIGVRRRTDDKWIGGVCSGLADRLGVDPVIIRVSLVVLSLFWGFGVIVYLFAWVLLANDKNEIVAERALREGDGGSIVLTVLAVFALFGGLTFGNDRAFPILLVPFIVLVWWLTHRSQDRPDADQRVIAHQYGSPYSASQPPATFGPSLTKSVPPPASPGPPQPAPRPAGPRKLRRRSGGALMALLAIGLALVTYGSLIWLGTENSWSGDHVVIALAGSLATMGLLLVGLGLAGWRAGFLAFLTVVLAITAWSSAVVPAGINAGGQVGDATWTPTSLTTDTNYHLGVGEGVLNLSELPVTGLSEAKVPVYVGVGELTVIVPENLTVKFVGHVGLGEILLPGEGENQGDGGTGVTRSIVVGDGPTEVIVDAGVGLGQLTLVKE